MRAKEENQKKNSEEEISEQLNIEELMDVQGGIEDDSDDDRKGSCGLGCYIGTGSSEPPIKSS
jgi:hypothetical protein